MHTLYLYQKIMFHKIAIIFKQDQNCYGLSLCLIFKQDKVKHNEKADDVNASLKFLKGRGSCYQVCGICSNS